jgi:hypothetical protein
MFGAYPFQAVATDGYFISKTFNAPEEFMGMKAPGPLFLFWGLVSLPVDLAIDVVLLPIDLGAWVFGEYKLGRSAKLHDAAQPAPADPPQRPARG